VKTVIALLRGINVGGHGKLPMAELVKICEAAGCVSPRTYIQSGNVVFGTKARDFRALKKKLEHALHAGKQLVSPVFLRSPEELRAILDENPFSGAPGYDPSRLAILFLPQALTPPQRAALAALPCADSEEIVCRDAEIFVYFPQGMGRSKVPALIDRALRIPSTARSANTVEKLWEMAAARPR
jgi:uncharacterized protein (DUF1697 family)